MRVRLARIRPEGRGRRRGISSRATATVSSAARDGMSRTLDDLSMRDRKELLVCYDGGRLQYISQPRAAAMLNVTPATLKKLLNGRRTIEEHRETGVAAENGSRRARRRSELNRRFVAVEMGLLRWFRDALGRGLPVDEAALLAKAGEFAARLGVANFTANLSWALHWKHKYNLSDAGVKWTARQRAGTGDRDTGASSTDGNGCWDAMLRRYGADHVYSLVDTGFFYLSYGPDGERLARRLGVVLACNVTGTDRLKPLVLDNDRDPRYPFDVKPLLDAGGDRWTTGSLGSFAERLDRAVRPRRVLLVLDRRLELPPGLRLRHVRVASFPAADGATVHPLGTHVIRNAAAYEFYARRALPPAGHLTVLDFVHLLSDVWRNVPAPVVRNCFRALGWTRTAAERVRENVRADFERWTARYRGAPVEPSDSDGVPRTNADVFGREQCASVPELTDASAAVGNVHNARGSRPQPQLPD